MAVWDANISLLLGALFFNSISYFSAVLQGAAIGELPTNATASLQSAFLTAVV